MITSPTGGFRYGKQALVVSLAIQKISEGRSVLVHGLTDRWQEILRNSTYKVVAEREARKFAAICSPHLITIRKVKSK